MRNILVTTNCLLITFSLFIGCNKEVFDTVIFDRPFVIENGRIEFQSNLYRKCNTASVRIELGNDFTVEPPWIFVQLVDGRKFRISVVLVSEDGNMFKSKIIGRAGGMVDVRFEPQIPKKIAIKKVIVTSDVPLSCKRIIWHDFNAN
jgi:hypothetical protein